MVIIINCNISAYSNDQLIFIKERRLPCEVSTESLWVTRYMCTFNLVFGGLNILTHTEHTDGVVMVWTFKWEIPSWSVGCDLSYPEVSVVFFCAPKI